jgi:hypothetical protein
MSISKDQALNIGRTFRMHADNIGNFLYEHRNSLSEKQYKKLECQEKKLIEMSSSVIPEVVGFTFKGSKTSLGLFISASNELRGYIDDRCDDDKHNFLNENTPFDKRIEEIINAASKLVTIGDALISKSPSFIYLAINDAFTLI